MTVEHFDVAMVGTAMAANTIDVPLTSGRTLAAIALDFGGYDPETDRRVVCRIVLIPDAVDEMVERLADLERR